MSRVHYPTFQSLHLRYNSFSNPSVALPTSQLIVQPFRRFTQVTAHSPTFPLLHLRHSSFLNPSFASPTSQALQLRYLASRLLVPQCVFRGERNGVWVGLSRGFSHLLCLKFHSPISPHSSHSSAPCDGAFRRGRPAPLLFPRLSPCWTRIED